MTEMCEGVHVPCENKEDEVKEVELKPKTIRIALFFDGTLNNRSNISAREKESDDYLWHHDSDGGDSYDNGRTNIAIMQSHVGTDCSDYDFFSSGYIEGQGTFNLKGDSLWGYALAIGDSGVVGRAKTAVSRLVTLITRFDNFDKKSNNIEKLTIDVYGFSRGAATARYAIYLMLKDKKRPVFKRLKDLGYKIEESAVEIGFAGLYDTVLSYMASQKFKSSNNKLEQTAVKYAKKSLHLAAAEEHRKDFPLHNIKGAPGGEEYFLPGVHSDVGGSYNKANEDLLEQQEAAYKDAFIAGDSVIEDGRVYMLASDESLVINKGKADEIFEDMEYLAKQGWYRHANLANSHQKNKTAMLDALADKQVKRRKKSVTDGEFTMTLYYRRKRNDYQNLHPMYATLSVRRQAIASAYSNIPLKIMAEYVIKETKIKLSDKLKRRADLILKQSKLTALDDDVKSYVASTSSSKPQDWLDNDEIKNIRHDHLHFSSHLSIGYRPRFSKGKRKRYIYDA